MAVHFRSALVKDSMLKVGFVPDVEEVRKQAQHRWFSAAEILEVMKNHERLCIFNAQRVKKPTSGSFFVIKRRMVREFKKDDHNWTKKKDGKTIQEAHEKLKVGNIEMLQCLYAHGQENENFQRRIYWMIQGEPSDIALFHYLEIKRTRKRCGPENDISGERPARSFGECHNICQQNIDWQDHASNFFESLHKRFEDLLSLSFTCPNYSDNNIRKVPALYHKIKESLNEEDSDWGKMSIPNLEKKISSDMIKVKILKEKLHLWLLQKVVEGGSGLTMLDKDGQGVIHFSAALGYNWALKAIVAAGVDINFPDVNQWTALHWAASCHRQHTVWYLITLGALSYPNSRNPFGKTIGDLASEKEHQGTNPHLRFEL